MDDKSKTSILSSIGSDDEVSVRAKNICLYNDLETIVDLIAYKHKHGDFMNLRACGQMTNLELIDICNRNEEAYQCYVCSPINKAGNIGKKYGSGIWEYKPNEVVKVSEFNAPEQRRKKRKAGNHFSLENMDQTWKDNLTLLQTKINEYVSYLSAKAYRVLSTHLGRDFSAQNFYFQFYLVEIPKLGYLNYGDFEVNDELLNLKQLIKTFFDQYDFVGRSLQNDTNTNKYKVKEFIHSHSLDFDSSLTDKLVTEDDEVKIFALFRFLLINEKIYKAKTMEVFNHMFKNDANQSLSEHEFEKKQHIPKIQYALIKERLFVRTLKIFNFISQLSIDLKKQYDFAPDSDIFYLTDEEMDKINKNENTNFNKRFAHIMFHSSLSDTYDLIGFGSESIMKGSKINPDMWMSNYLVNKELSKKFHFEDMLEDMQVRLSKPFHPDQHTKVNNDVLDYFIKADKKIQKKVVHVCRKILHEEGTLKYDESITEKLAQKPFLQPLEAVKEILTESKVPLTYHLLMTKLNHMCPNHHLSQHEVEVMLEACPDIYYGGRHIGYGLKSWSKTTEILKNGRISDAAIEILRHETEPITIKSLLRKLSAHRAIVNFTTGFEDLKSEKNKSIAFFKGGYVALQKNPADSAVDDVDDDELEYPVFPLGKWDD